MMRMMNNKANVKIFSIVIAAFLLFPLVHWHILKWLRQLVVVVTAQLVLSTSRMMSQDNPIYIFCSQEYGLSKPLQQAVTAKITQHKMMRLNKIS